MRIPPSVIVMSVLTAVPFGLGIRDTLAHQGALGTSDGDGLLFDDKRSIRERERVVAEMEAEARREAEEREARNARRKAQLDTLYGAKVASMGALLDGIVLGASAGSFQPEHVRMRIEQASRDGFIAVAFNADAAALNGVIVSLADSYESPELCSALGDKLAAAWGPATRGTWLDPDAHQRATLLRDSCQLVFDRYLDPVAWVAQLPLQRLGGAVDKLTADLGGTVEDADDDFVTWHMPGLPYGKGEATALEAYVVGGKVAGFKATLASDFDSQLAVRDALSAKLKVQPKKDEATGAWVWKGRVPVMLEEIDTEQFSLTVGKF